MTKINTKEFTEKAVNLMKFNDGDTDYLIWQGDRLMMQNRSGISAYTTITDIGEQRVIFPAKAIELIKKVKAETCEIDLEGKIITVKYNRSKAKFNMATLSVDISIPDESDFPKLNVIPNRIIDDIKKIARICAQKDFGSKSTDGLYLNGNGKELDIVATDGYRIAVLTTDKCKAKMQLIVHRTVIDKIIAIAASEDADINIAELDKNKALIKVADYTIIAPTLAVAKFIDYKLAIKQFNFSVKVAANPYELKAALERVAICREKNNAPIIFSAENNAIYISAYSSSNRIVEEVSSNCVDKPVERGFNPMYFQELVSFFNSDIDLQFCDAANTTPLSITKEEDGQRLFVLMLPMRYKKEAAE